MVENDENNKHVCSDKEIEQLILENRNFAYSIVNKEFSKYSWEVKEDLNSAAIEGLCYAAQKYDPTRKDECKFISYAVHWIRYYINEEIRKLFPIKFNQNYISKRNKILQCINNYKKENNNEEPPISYISQNLNISEKVVKNVLNINNGNNFTFLSFNSPVDSEKSNPGNTGESLNNDKLVKEYLDENSDSSLITRIEVSDMIQQLKKNVNKKEFNIFYDYYMHGETISELAKKYNLKFPSSVAYLIKKCENKCKELIAE